MRKQRRLAFWFAVVSLFVQTDERAIGPIIPENSRCAGHDVDSGRLHRAFRVVGLATLRGMPDAVRRLGVPRLRVLQHPARKYLLAARGQQFVLRSASGT